MKNLFGRMLLLASLVVAGAIGLPAAYLPPGTPDTIALLAPPPEAGSAEAKADLENTFVLHQAATPA